jgi:dUTP pyrophosphatase
MKVKKLVNNAIIPTHGSVDAAGWDLYSTGDYSIAPGGMVKISTGLAFEIPINTFGGVFPRSGYATKKGLRLANCVAVIDADYRGEVLVPLYNDSNEVQEIKAGDRIAQLVILPFVCVTMEETDNLSDTVRGNGGFGSTGA